MNPSQHKGRVPQYSRNKFAIKMQTQYYELEHAQIVQRSRLTAVRSAWIGQNQVEGEHFQHSGSQMSERTVIYGLTENRPRHSFFQRSEKLGITLVITFLSQRSLMLPNTVITSYLLCPMSTRPSAPSLRNKYIIRTDIIRAFYNIPIDLVLGSITTDNEGPPFLPWCLQDF